MCGLSANSYKTHVHSVVVNPGWTQIKHEAPVETGSCPLGWCGLGSKHWWCRKGITWCITQISKRIWFRYKRFETVQSWQWRSKQWISHCEGRGVNSSRRSRDFRLHVHVCFSQIWMLHRRGKCSWYSEMSMCGAVLRVYSGRRPSGVTLTYSP